MPFGNKWPSFGTKYRLGKSNPFGKTNDEGDIFPPPPKDLISINEDNTIIIITSTGEELTTN